MNPRKGLPKPNFEYMEQVTYCLNELDEETYTLGIFIYDSERYSVTGKYWALSPMFDSLDECLDWCRSKGYKYQCVFKPQTVGKAPC